MLYSKKVNIYHTAYISYGIYIIRQLTTALAATKMRIKKPGARSQNSYRKGIAINE